MRCLVASVMLAACGPGDSNTPDAAVDASAMVDSAIDADLSPGLSCHALYGRGLRTSGSYMIDPDATGSIAPFSVWCDMTADGGWTLAATISTDVAGPWQTLSTWSATTTFGTSDSRLFNADMKNTAYSAVPFLRLRLVSSLGGEITSNPITSITLSTLFASTDRESFIGISAGWSYSGTNNTNFIAEIQNPPVTDGINRSERNACVLATGYDTFPDGVGSDDQVQGFGCVAGTGGTGACSNSSCGEVSREASVHMFIR